MLLPYPIQIHNGKSRFTRYMYGHQNDITGVMCGWPVYMIQTLSFTKKKWRVYARHMAIKGHT